jgi:hypothetical protein
VGKQQPKRDNVVKVDPKQAQEGEGRLKFLGGSRSDEFNSTLLNQALNTLWLKHADEHGRDELIAAAASALAGIGPKDELEGMLAAQMVAAHSAAMESYRRSMLSDQTFEGRKENLSQANKLSRTYTTLLEALNRHRGKGQQKVTVEHVHVHAGGQAIVGAVEHPGGGVPSGNQEQPHAKVIKHAPEPALWSEDPQREAGPVARDE